MSDRRVIIAVNMPDDFDVHTISDIVMDNGSDATTWEWADFFSDVADGVVGPKHDSTATNPPIKEAAR